MNILDDIGIVFQKLRSRVAVFLREPATISFASWAVTSVATALMTTHVSSVSDMGNSANVNPPAKCSRADRTPIRSSKRSQTGGGIPSGSSRTHSETMCDVDETSLAASEGDWHPALTNLSSTPGSSSGGSRSDATRANPGMRGSWGRSAASEIPRDVCCPSTPDPFDIGSGSCAPTGGTPVAEVEGETSTPSATFSREGTLTGRPQGGQLRARTFTATALIGRYGTTPASSPCQGLAPTYSQSFSVLLGCTYSRSHTPLDCARRTDLTPWRAKLQNSQTAAQRFSHQEERRKDHAIVSSPNVFPKYLAVTAHNEIGMQDVEIFTVLDVFVKLETKPSRTQPLLPWLDVLCSTVY
ncbi:hypothetical protein E1301_Tti023126 [Triplophysa tibetana]|uniref:Uncharacterized protein n=1 Tax=Triplophysa tibetana TaxID=1572043 RepID=A0A5A9P4H5_9TELE|nr:hypothetical protein E1301_Tti023126 [Triplophysa tibetana]